MTRNELTLILSHALASEAGIRVQSNSPERLRMKLYNARKNQPEFANLSFVLSPASPTTDLWIVKRG